MIDYKNTLNLPSTEFPMRGNLARREINILESWHNHNLYGIIRQARKGKQTFILHDGPPYANGNIHIGHSVNKILKDIIIKSKTLMGYDSPYIPGWDCHGLPIELHVEQLIGKPGEKVSVAEFRDACRRYAYEQVEEQKKDFIRLGIIGDWENSYLTMNFITEANIIRSLGKIIANGHLNKGNKPVHWCVNCCSALAETEVEYCNYSSTSIDITFTSNNIHAVTATFNTKKILDKISLVIWTTTPWTLPANRAIAVHPDLNYQLIEVAGQGYILATNLVKNTMARLGIIRWTVLGCVKGNALEMLRFQHPFMEFDIPVILSQHITLNIGTGVVHIAPGHGPDDYMISQQYNLEVFDSIDSKGYYLSGILPILDGLQIFKANDVIINLILKNNSLLHREKIEHNYPHCWRHKTPVIFRTTPQWFISMDRNNLRKQSLKMIQSVLWIPSWGQKRIETMIANRPDWCISRQRAWGVPITLFVHNETEELHPRTIELIEIIAQKVELNGIQAWWDLDPNEILGKDADHYHKVLDTLDVWFDSGSTHFSVLERKHEKLENHTIDMYLEGSDQHRGWFMSSLMISVAMHNKAPYRQVLTHGFIVDKQGKKMSKSLGNVVSPQKVFNKLGADVLRLWVASTDYTSEMVMSEEVLTRSADTYRRIRNTARFLLSNLNDFDPINDSVCLDKMVILDCWAISQTQLAQNEIISSYENYDLHNVVQRIMQFCSIEMGSFYLDIIKDRQYTTKVDSIAHRSCQTAIYNIIEALVRWIAPIMSFTADEIWSFIPGKRAQYVFTEEWYDGLFKLNDNQPLNSAYWQAIAQVRNETNKIIEQARVDKRIGSSLEACITLYAKPDIADLLRKLGDELCFVLLTSYAIVSDYINANNDAVECENIKGLKIGLTKAEGKKCLRCWHYRKDIGKDINYPEICGRCILNLIGPGEERRFV